MADVRLAKSVRDPGDDRVWVEDIPSDPKRGIV
jgi:hypothetical protein